jgi:signal transduction histidine kinase
MSLRLTIRMAAPSIAISLLLLTLGSVGGWYVHRLQKSTAALVKGTAALVALDMSTIRAAEELVFGINEIRAELTGFLLTGNRAHLEAIPAKCSAAEESLAKMERLADDSDEIALAGQIRNGYRSFSAECRQMTAAASEARTREIVRHLYGESLPRDVLAPAKKLLAHEEQLVRRSEDLVRRSGDDNQKMAGRITFFLWLLGGCGAVAGLVAGFGIARSVSHSIVKLYVPIRAVSGRLEEVVGPVDVAPDAGIENLDSILHRVADQVGTVVDRLQQSQTDMLRSEQMAALGQLAAGLAHELRNPLTAMKILVQDAVASGPAASLGGRDLAVLHTETARLERSIEAFLDFARPPTLEKHSRDLREAVRQTIDLVAARGKQQGIEIQCQLPDQPLPIEADHEQVRQLLLNLVLNAMDAQLQSGVVRITVGQSPDKPGAQAARARQPQPASWVTLTVADHGPGIAADMAGRIFDPYVSTKETGLGLGLAICRRIVKDHGGEIFVNNAASGGAVFTVRLPVHPLPPA